MFRALVLSDSHRDYFSLAEALRLHREADAVFFLGDGESDIKRVGGMFAAQIVAVRGNNDFRAYYDNDVIEEIGGVRFFLTHGHRYGVRMGLDTLLSCAKENNCAFALFGHTHEAVIKDCGGITLLNPGSLGYPYNAPPSYGIIEGDKDSLSSKIVFI